jgi:adenylate cyclase
VKIALSRRTLAILIGILLAAGSGYVLVYNQYRIGHFLENKSYDLSMVARGELAANETVLVYLDEKSHDELKQPYTAAWDRTIHARFVERMTAAGAKAVVFDILFTDPNTNNPAADEHLAKAMKANGRVVLGADLFREGFKRNKGIPPFDLLADKAAGFGLVELFPDYDLIVREHTPENDNPVPNLSRAVIDVTGTKKPLPEAGPNQRWMNYYGPPNYLPWISLSEALDPSRTKDDFFRDKVVFVGAKLLVKFSGDRKDEFRNPFSFWLSQEWVTQRGALFMPGVEVQATAFLNLYRGDWLRRWPYRTESAIILTIGILVGGGLIFARPIMAVAIGIGAMALTVLISQIAFAHRLLWFPWLMIWVEIVVAVGWSVLFNSVQLYVQKRLLEHTLGLYLSPKLAKKFARDPGFLKAGAEEQTISIFFSDIADFTVASQAMSSKDLAQLMNHYFETAVSECIHKTDGTVVKYIGDAIFAFWNAPEPQPDHSARACAAALYLASKTFIDPNGKTLRTRVGVHAGLARIGNFGSSERVDYTALGENVNLASRLEGLNKYLGTNCLITRETMEGAGDSFVTRSLGLFQMKGFEKPVDVYELIGWAKDGEASRRWRETFAQALDNYHDRNLEFAEAGFRETLELHPDDGPAKFYLEKLEELRTQNLPGDWATHTILREK